MTTTTNGRANRLRNLLTVLKAAHLEIEAEKRTLTAAERRVVGWAKWARTRL